MKSRRAKKITCEPLESRLLFDIDPWSFDTWTDWGSGWDTDTSSGSDSDSNSNSGSIGIDVGGGSSWDEDDEPIVIINPPDAPTNLTAHAVTSSSIFLSWAGSSDADGYKIHRLNANGRWTTIASTSGTQYTDRRLKAGSTYTYFVDAYNEGGYSEDSNTATETIPVPTDPSIVGEFANYPGGPASVTFNFVDADGTDVTLKLGGLGIGTLRLTPEGYNIDVTDTTSRTSLRITTLKTKTPGDDGRFLLHNLTVGNLADAADHSSLSSLVGSKTDLAGTLTITGAVAKITLGNVMGSTLTIGDSGVTRKPLTTLRLGQVMDTSLTVADGIRTLSVKSWQDTDATPDVITAPRLIALRSAGDFDADLVLSGAGLPLRANTLRTASIAGSVHDADWDITGKTGLLVIRGDLIDSEIRASASIAKARVHAMEDSRFVAGIVAPKNFVLLDGIKQNMITLDSVII